MAFVNVRSSVISNGKEISVLSCKLEDMDKNPVCINSPKNYNLQNLTLGKQCFYIQISVVDTLKVTEPIKGFQEQLDRWITQNL